MTSEHPTRRLGPGRYVLDGEPAPGVTKIVGKGFPKPALVGWAARTVAGYAVDFWEELDALSPSERLRKLEKAQWASRDEAAVRGKDVHAFYERLAAGEEVTPPEPLVGYVDAYLDFVREWRPREVLVEATVVNRRCRYAGTLDLIADLADGARWLLDWKTSKSGIWPESALQLAAYRNAETYLAEDGEKPMPSVDRCGCVWIRPDGYDVIPVEADASEFRTFLYVQQVARFVETPRENIVLDALSPPALEAEVAT